MQMTITKKMIMTVCRFYGDPLRKVDFICSIKNSHVGLIF